MNALSKAIEHVGGKSALARHLKLKPQVVNNWVMRDSVPPQYAKPIEALTGGKVSAEELRPDIFGPSEAA